MTEPPPDRKSLRRAFAASLSGTTLEYYDFAVYSVASATILGKLFFPSSDELAGTMLAFSTYAVGYVSRPFGGFLFGRLGDILGRKQVLVFTLLLTGIATFLIGVLPTHAALGGGAAVLLVLLRFAQGVGVGGEWGGAVLLSSEFGDPKRRGFWASAAQIGPPAGTLLANGVLPLLALILTTAQFESWGWRIAFLLSGVLVLFGLWLRLRLEETPVFREIAARGERPKAPVREVLREEPRALVTGILVRICPDVLYSLFTVFVLTYMTTKLHMPKSDGTIAVMIGSACQLFLMPAFGALSDRLSRRTMYLVGTIAAAVWPFVFFPLAGTRSFAVIIVGVVVALAIHALLYGPQAALITEQFSARLRYTGSSLAYTLAGVVGGAVAPLVFTALLAGFGTWVVVALYLAFTGVLTLVGVLLSRVARETPEPVGARP
ncbi:MHS family MFS transporter [Amycolatopsis acidiphila]|uniref:MHS family MFS transporter n=1 Tax=Amycolatopsis acidiphila TaxID=715473 RepID=A0A558A9P5_9PSEU|nr:MFS transporter [Amycolatopsis acidiphila]TVT20979.1 MHS family MFS transporter [Amycolatopsis acidiphila]UIJ61361.1 MHS family MFS transporter [Amycolatopsis acidiphila]GHG78040.1 MFS transporter [Amycolatopsis acidiphila]